ncbi:phage protein Gp36 family protein [Falsiroseomonas sp.]|uniref:phage protein Gp36 family protein n=1 Tax=Falsiroseomonas sp. TaxID=2870721 RepID=UPI003F7307F9
MPYASVEDMIARFGEVEMIRLSAPAGQLDEMVVRSSVELALVEASALIDSYIRRRYPVPVAAPVPAEIVRACRILARYDLSRAEQKTTGSDLVTDRDQVIAWLKMIAEGKLDLPIAVAPATGTGGLDARVSDREPTFIAGGGLNW